MLDILKERELGKDEAETESDLRSLPSLATECAARRKTLDKTREARRAYASARTLWAAVIKRRSVHEAEM